MTTIRSRAAFVISVLVFLLAALPLVAFAAPGDLDASFGTGGIVTTAIGAGNDQAHAVAIQGDGKIVVVGSCLIDNNDFCLARYTSAGILDTDFSGDGKVTTAIAVGTDNPAAVAIQGDGKIIAAGACFNISFVSDFCLARYNSDGSLDTNFSGDGKVTTEFGTADDFAGAVAIQGDGKIVAAGRCRIVTNNDFCLARYNSDGSLDSSFDTDGRVTTAIGANEGFDDAFGVAIQTVATVEKIVVVGSCDMDAANVGNLDFCLARYNESDGSLDTTFGGGGTGTVTTSFGTVRDIAQDVAIQSDGKIVAAGVCGPLTAMDFCLARYTSAGILDTSFDGDGMVTTDFGFNDSAFAVAIQGDGKVVAAGMCSPASGFVFDFCLARYTSGGVLDTSFGAGATGKIVTPIVTGDDEAQAVAIQSDGKIVAAGPCDMDSTAGVNYDFCLARYLVDAPVTDLRAIIDAQPKLTNGQKAALKNKLDAAEAYFQAGKIGPACGKLNDFINQVVGLTPAKLDAATSATLVDGANALKVSYGCP